MDVGLLLLRAVLGALLIGHGTQKLFGWFGGPGLDGAGEFVRSLGHRPGRPMAALASFCEAGGGLLLVLGFLSPLSTAIVVGVMVVAASAHWPKLWVTEEGFELPGFYAVAAAALAFTGPGRYSIDNAIGWSYGWSLAIGAIAFGGLAAAFAIIRAHTPPHITAPLTTTHTEELEFERELVGADR